MKNVRISESLFSENVTNLTSNEVISDLKGVPSVDVTLDSNIVDFLVDSKIVSSKREAREFVDAGAISINNKKITDFKTGWFEYFEANMPDLNNRLNEGDKLSDEDQQALRTNLESYIKTL